MTLAEHLAALNAEKQAWMDAGPDRWTGFWVEDLAHWAEIGVYTVEDFKRYDLETLVWDMYKDVCGFRPRHLDLKAMSLQELEDLADYLGKQIEASIEDDEAWDYEDEDTSAWDREPDQLDMDAPEPIDYIACHYQEGWL